MIGSTRIQTRGSMMNHPDCSVVGEGKRVRDLFAIINIMGIDLISFPEYRSLRLRSQK
jgi:hypothetical protein